MKHLKYFIQFIFILSFFLFFKILGAENSSKLSGKIFKKIGPFFRSKKIIESNLKKAFPNIENTKIKKISESMWDNYGRTFAEYMFIKNFRFGILSKNICVKGQEILKKIKRNKEQVIFISGHFANFELMSMYLDKSEIKLSTIYRPLNNKFLNPIMERIREKYICKNQIKKGIGGIKKLIRFKKDNFSTALMIDQRVSEGILSNFFGHKAFTTTIPAQLVKKFNIPVVPVYIDRVKDIHFEITIMEPMYFSKNQSVEFITDRLNKELESMILKNPENWIWSHNRWK